MPSGVVLNSGVSYLQLSTWQYLKTARFMTDPSAPAPLIQVSGAPEFIHCNALYAATTSIRPSGQPVYVSISPDELYGPQKSKTDPKEWDGIPLKKSLCKNHPLLNLMTRASSSEIKWATERIVYWEDGFLCFQSVTAYGTEHFMIKIDCDSALHPAKSTHIITNFDWDAKRSIMVLATELTVSVSSISCSSTLGDTKTHKLSFGPVKFAVRVSNSQPNALRKQMFHKDGPTMFDPQQFDANGNILTNAPAQAKRTSALPLGISRSGLFAFFTSTF